ncbi:Pkinase-domain-containing protein [Backusella circina FSU 941]|nr:Pkinase-domain-containing protein [Backusella circina FSU 941]
MPDSPCSTPVTPNDQQHFQPLTSTRSSRKVLTERLFQRRASLVSTTEYPNDESPTRYLPQKQAVIATQDNWRISVANQIAAMILSGSERNTSEAFIGKHILDFVDADYRHFLLEKIVKRREELFGSNKPSGNILICGDMVPILKQDGCKSSASLWLKEKKNTNGLPVFIWILEEVFQSTVEVIVDKTNTTIQSAKNHINGIYGYSPNEVENQPVKLLLPHFNGEQKFFGSCSKLGAHFPVIVRMQECPLYNTLRITSIPTLSGLVTVWRNGTIESFNTVFAKYLLGFSNNELTGTNIAMILPQFPTLVANLERDDLLQHGFMLNNLICRQMLASTDNSTHNQPYQQRRLTLNPGGSPLPIIIAIHRDGTPFEIDIQLKLQENSDDLFTLWISFDRDSVLTKFGHVHIPQPLTYLSDPPLHVARSKSINIPTKEAKKITTRRSKDDQYPATQSSAIAVIPSFIHHSSCIQSTTAEKETSRPGALKTHITDYEIMDELGQGAYGLVKLAYLKEDPEKKKTIIKYIIKSRILVDCWIRSRDLGLVPAEVHVLHTLRNIPHVNCTEMLDYFEDEDNYYVVMDLFGEGMDLFDYIELNSNMKESEIRLIFYQVVSAVGHLHDNGIVHRDVKDENVILDLKGGVRLIDFGSAAYVKPGRKFNTFVGTLDYAAPEVLRGQSYTGLPQDIWACGILLFTLIYRENPFYNIEEIMERELRVPFVLSDDSLDLVKKMLNRNVDQRLNIHQVLDHPWFHHQP